VFEDRGAPGAVTTAADRSGDRGGRGKTHNHPSSRPYDMSATEQTADGDGPSTLVNALVGGVAAVLLAFLPFSPVLGGALAGYLQGPDTGEGFEELEPVERGPVAEGTDLDDVVGELVVSGPNVMKGYYGLPEANGAAFTEVDGTRWFHTGDLGYRDEDGLFDVVDREKHMIVTGGYDVYAREVEELLFEHPDVVDAAVVGIPDERRGETVKAFVVPTPGAEATPGEVREYCLERLAAYKHPREVEFVEDLPRPTTGKVQKFELRGEGE